MYRDELRAVLAQEVICKIYVRIDEAPPHKDTKGRTEFEEVVRVVRVHRKPVVAVAGVDEVLVWILLLLVLGSRECSMHTFGEAFNHLRCRSPFGSLEGSRESQQTSGGCY
jgi:hypothetical protein